MASGLQAGRGFILQLNTMQVFKYESAKDLAKSIFCNSIWSPEFLTGDTQEYNPWLEVLFIENSKQEHVNDPARNVDRKGIGASSIYKKNQQSR